MSLADGSDFGEVLTHLVLVGSTDFTSSRPKNPLSGDIRSQRVGADVPSAKSRSWGR